MKNLDDLTQEQLRDLRIDFTKYKQDNGWGNKSMNIYDYREKIWGNKK